MITKCRTEDALPTATPAPCRSMTGYATVRAQFRDRTIRVCVKSVNHRLLDLKLRLPDSLELYEHRLRHAVIQRIHRGQVDIRVGVDLGQAVPVNVNRELLKAYRNLAEEACKRSGAKAELDLVALLRLPGVITGWASALPETEDAQEELGRLLEMSLEEALGKLDEMRAIEGRQITEQLRARAAHIADATNQIRKLASALRPGFSRRLQVRVRPLLNGASVDPKRLAQEAALLAEASNVSEELDRLGSHLRQFYKLLDAGGEVGKKLDFLLQQMHGEAKTMLSKTPADDGEALAICDLALEINLQLEKLREQVQNIE